MNSIRDDLKAFVDGELSEERSAEVGAAIDADPQLQQEVEFMRMLGLEIKRAAIDPKVVGRPETIDAIRNRPKRFKWSDVNSWGFALQSVMAIVLIGIISAVLFPVFAQSKYAAKKMSQDAIAAEMSAKAALDMENPAPASIPSENPANNGRGGGAFSNSSPQDADVMDGPARKEFTFEDAKGSERAKTTIPMAPNSPRRVIKTADIGLRVDDVSVAMKKASSIADGLGGFVTNSSAANLKDVQPTGFVTVRVPSQRYDTAMTQLLALGEVISENSSGDDVTGQVADLDARLKVLRAEEDSYVTMLRGARKVGEMLEIKERLSTVRQEIESQTAQVKSLKDLASLSTITCNFTQKIKRQDQQSEEESNGFDETWNGAVNGLQSALKFLGSAVIVLFVYSPIWLPIVLVIWWLSRRAKRA